MKKIELVKGIESSVLGFGCAPILGSVSKDKADRAIDVAIEQGINHFDIAPSYGYGEAEKFVGRKLSSQRDKYIIATKFGIEATRYAKILRPLKPLIRETVKLLKSKKNNITEAKPNLGVTMASKFFKRFPISSLISSIFRHLSLTFLKNL